VPLDHSIFIASAGIVERNDALNVAGLIHDANLTRAETRKFLRFFGANHKWTRMNPNVVERPPRQTTLSLRVCLAPKPRSQYYRGATPQDYRNPKTTSAESAIHAGPSRGWHGLGRDQSLLPNPRNPGSPIRVYSCPFVVKSSLMERQNRSRSAHLAFAYSRLRLWPAALRAACMSDFPRRWR